MHFLEHYYEKTIKYDLINKFNIKNTKKIPKLEKIVLNFGCKSSEITQLAPVLLFLEMVTNKRGSVTKSNKANSILKIRKGYPVGCKIVLRKTEMYYFLDRLLYEIFPKIREFEKTVIRSKIGKKTLSYKIADLLVFNELEEHYSVFPSKLPPLDITLVSNTEFNEEMSFLIKSLKIPTRY